MQRERIWQVRPLERRTERNRILPITGGDGATLSLKFTTGNLDSRITFTRLSNATFTNLQGYIQYALANMQNNTTFDGIGGTTYAVGWGGFVGTGASFERLSSGVLKCKAASSAATNSNRAFLSTLATIPIGLPITLKMTLRDVSYASSVELVNLVSFTTASTSYTQYRVNGVQQNTNFAGAVAGDVITVTVIPTTASGNFRVGLGCQGNLSLNDYVTIENVMLEQGEEFNATYSFLPNSSTTLGNFNTPRFDYSPTSIGEAKGLLFEGQASNYIPYSNTFSNAAWEKGTGGANDVVIAAPTPTTETLAPDGLYTATKITKPNTGPGYGFIRQGALSTGTVSGVRTISIWVKQPSSGSARYFGLRSTGNSFQPIPGDYHATFDLQTGTVVSNAGTAYYTSVSISPAGNGWYRIRATTGSMDGIGTCYASYAIVEPVNGAENNFQTGSVYIWGAQLEVGTGSSSYIPTGASAGTRNADSCVMNDITQLKYSNQTGSIYWSGVVNKQPISYATLIGFMAAGDLPTYETFGNALNYFTAARGSTLTGGGGNELSRSYTIGNNIRYASSINTTVNPIVRVNLNGSAGSVNKSGTGDMYVATRFVIGRGASYVLHYPSVTIKEIRYYPVSLNAAQLNNLVVS